VPIPEQPRDPIVDATLAADGVVLRFGRTDVVHGADLTLEPGRVTALVGPNGSGKSTLLRALARLHAPAEGVIRLGGDDVGPLRRDEFARKVTLLSQQRPVPGGLTRSS
jgi:iron-chelate-transporting ATPase